MATNFSKHHNVKERKEEWYTPPEIFTALGRFDLDPCGLKTWPTAKTIYESKGLEQKWFGRVWLNPPYNKVAKWMAKMAEHNNGIALTFARVETRWFCESVWRKASALLFFKKRLIFHHETGAKADFNAGAPSVLIAYGQGNALSLMRSKLNGIFVCGQLEL